VTVIGANRPPRFVRLPLIKGEPGAQITIQLEAVDPDPDEVLTFSAEDPEGRSFLPEGAVLDAETGEFNWTPTTEQSGPYKPVFSVTDSRGARDLMLVHLLIGQGHVPPALASIDSMSVNQNEEITFQVNINNPEQIPPEAKLRFYARKLPRGAFFNPDERNFFWTPGFFQKGDYHLVVGVGDGRFRTEQNVSITVNAVVLKPTLDALEDFTVSEGDLLSFMVFGQYPDGRRVVFDEPDSLPENSSFDVVSGVFRFTPDYEQAGGYQLTFSVTTEDGETISVSNEVTVEDKNRRPLLVGLENVLVAVGEPVSIEVKAEDPDSDDVLTYSASGLPADAAFDAAADPALLSWTPTQEGSYALNFTVTDQADASDNRAIIITVGDSINQPPILGEMGSVTVSEGDTLTVTVSASDPEGETVSIFINPMPENSAFDDQNNTFTFQPDFTQAGIYYLSVVASDGELTDNELVEITVADVSRPPTISVPTEWSIEEGDTLEFVVKAEDASGQSLEVFSGELPNGAELIQSSGEFSWVPDFDQAGEYKVTFLTGDGAQTADIEVTIMVADRNRRPRIFQIDHQRVLEGETISFEITYFDPDGDEVTITIDSTETPYMESVEIRNNSVFVFNTALLPQDEQIPSAVFIIEADDNRGGEDKRRVAFKIIRQKQAEVPQIPAGDSTNVNFPGMGLQARVFNVGGAPIGGGAGANINGSEISGSLTDTLAGEAVLLAASSGAPAGKYSYLSKSKDKVAVHPFLSGDGDLGGDFYGIRRGWGLDLSSDLEASLPELDFEITLIYEDRDIPARDIPEFTESAISIFGVDVEGNFVQLGTTLDTVNNTATTTEADPALYTDYTLGVILDLAAPVISGTTQLENTADELGPYTVSTTIVDNVLVRTAKLYYAVEGKSFQSVEMTTVADKINLFTADIPGQKDGQNILYYIEAGDSLHTVVDPVGAPETTYRFSVLYDGVAAIKAGDVNSSGKVDIFDLLGMLKVLSGEDQPTTGADVNEDGNVNIFDLLALLGILAGQ